MGVKGIAGVILVAGCGRLGFENAELTGAPDVGAPPVCTQGVLGYWPLDAGDLVGTTVRDRSGLGHDGTISGAPTPMIVPGRVGEGLAYAAAGAAFVRFPTLPVDGSPSAAITVSSWFFRDAQNVDDVLVYLPVSPKYDVWLTADARCAGLCLCVNTGSGDCWGVRDAGLVDRWVHLGVVFRNGSIDGSELFVDGQPRVASCLFGTCTTARTMMAPVELGGSDSYTWHGVFDEVRVHDRALTASEIASLHAGACSP